MRKSENILSFYYYYYYYYSRKYQVEFPLAAEAIEDAVIVDDVAKSYDEKPMAASAMTQLFNCDHRGGSRPLDKMDGLPRGAGSL